MEKRNCSRMRPVYYLRVVDEDTQGLAGGLIDITADGIRVSGTAAFEENSLNRLTMFLPDAISGERKVTVDARNIWCRRESRGEFCDYFTSGFQLENISADDFEVIEKSLQSFLFES